MTGGMLYLALFTLLISSCSMWVCRSAALRAEAAADRAEEAERSATRLAYAAARRRRAEP